MYKKWTTYRLSNWRDNIILLDIYKEAIIYKLVLIGLMVRRLSRKSFLNEAYSLYSNDDSVSVCWLREYRR